MPRNCCVSNCKNYQFNEGKLFHIFPKDPLVKNEWKRRLQIDGEPSKHQYVCSDHFRKSDYNISNHGKKFVLRKGSLPTSKTGDDSKNIGIEFRTLKTSTELDDKGKETFTTTLDDESDDDSEAFRILNESISSITWKTVLNDKTGNFKINPEVKLTSTMDSENKSQMINCDEHNSDKSVNGEQPFRTLKKSIELDEVGGGSVNRQEALLTLDETISSTALDDDDGARDGFFTTGKTVLNDKTGHFISNTTDLTSTNTLVSETNFMINYDEDSSEAWVKKLLQSDYVNSDFQAKGFQTSTNTLDSQNNVMIDRKGGSEECIQQLTNSGYLSNKNSVDKSVTAKQDVQDKGIQTSLPRKRTSYSSLSDEDLEYFTGLERQRFEIVYSILEKFDPIEDNMLLCKKSALVITLFKCRHNEDFKMMEFIFEVDRKLISEIFKEVIGKLYFVFKQIDIWKLSVKDPKAYRCILDCTEFFVVRAGDPNVHQLTFSYYKNHPTFKLMVSCDELGAVNFISEAFVGSTSDREIVIKSGILEKLEKGDAVMADKDFDISDLLEEKGVTVNIPPFLKGKEQLSEFEVMKTRIIANRRILIENVNCRAKKNKIIATTMQKCLWPYANQIIYVCFALVNFYKPLKDEED